MTPPAVTLSENLREAMRFFGAASPLGEIDTSPRSRSSRPASTTACSMPRALWPTGTGKTWAACGPSCGKPTNSYRRRNLPWSFWACDDFIDEGLRGRVHGAMEDMNMRHLTSAPGMYADSLAPPSRRLPEVTVRPVSDADTRSDFAHITSMAFEIPPGICHAVYSEDRAWQGTYKDGWATMAASPVCTDRPGGVRGGDWRLLGGYAARLPESRLRGGVNARGHCARQRGDGH